MQIFDQDDDDVPPSRRLITPDSRIVLLSIFGFWAFYAFIATLRSVVMEFPLQGEMAIRRAFVMTVGIILTLLLWMLLRLFARRAILTQALLIAVLTVPFAILSGASNYYFFNVYDPTSLLGAELMKLPAEFRPTPFQEIAEHSISRYFFLIGWGAFYIAIGFSARVAESERRASAFARAAQTAELRALRYQVNPHFLFNTLNSLSALVMNNRRTEAETMIMNLSNFYRTSLAGEPTEDVTLAEEIELQKLYLDIEKVRFPDRLSVEIDVPDALRDVEVPGLILQPLVENAVKHGVSAVARPVALRIAASAAAEKLTITVADTGNGTGDSSSKGNGIGLANVRDRLFARFGDNAALTCGPSDNGGFCVTLTIPMA